LLGLDELFELRSRLGHVSPFPCAPAGTRPGSQSKARTVTGRAGTASAAACPGPAFSSVTVHSGPPGEGNSTSPPVRVNAGPGKPARPTPSAFRYASLQVQYRKNVSGSRTSAASDGTKVRDARPVWSTGRISSTSTPTR